MIRGPCRYNPVLVAIPRTSAHHLPSLAPRPMGLQPGANPAGNRVPGSEMGLIGVYDMCGNYGQKNIHQWRCLVYMLIGVYDVRGNYGKKTYTPIASGKPTHFQKYSRQAPGW